LCLLFLLFSPSFTFLRLLSLQYLWTVLILCFVRRLWLRLGYSHRHRHHLARSGLWYDVHRIVGYRLGKWKFPGLWDFGMWPPLSLSLFLSAAAQGWLYPPSSTSELYSSHIPPRALSSRDCRLRREPLLTSCLVLVLVDWLRRLHRNSRVYDDDPRARNHYIFCGRSRHKDSERIRVVLCDRFARQRWRRWE
jgi:hypothetical protein